MEWAVWKPFYQEILKDFGFDPADDARSAEILSGLVDMERIPAYSDIVRLLGERVSVIGASRTLEQESDRLPEGRTIISAGSATERLMRMGIRPDIIVTDLDGDTRFDIEASAQGTLVFVHAHGDNIAEIERDVPRLSGPIVPTAQCRPFRNVYNFGGFTDGDRACFMAEHFGAREIALFAWDLERPYPKKGCDVGTKQRKLEWARRLLKGIPTVSKPLE